jgi:hypothetical protein
MNNLITKDSVLYGLMVEFETADEILHATRSAWQAGYREFDAYVPYPIEGLAAGLGMRHSRIPSIVLIGGLVGGTVGFGMQYWSMAVDYPLNVGGRPYNSWPVYVPITFEMLVLVASFAALLGMLFLNGLPKLHHPVFNVPGFERASQDRFFLCIETIDPSFDRERTAEFLAALKPLGAVIEVPQQQLLEELDGATASAHMPVESAALEETSIP